MVRPPPPTGAVRLLAARRPSLAVLPAFAVVAMVLVAVLGVVVQRVATSELRDEVDSRLAAVASTSAAALRRELAGTERLVASYAERKMLAAAVTDQAASSFDVDELARHLSSLVLADTGIEAAAAADLDGWARVRGRESFELVDVSGERWYRDVLRGRRPVVVTTDTSQLARDLRVVVATPIPEAPGDGIVGVLAVAYELGRLQSLADGSAADHGVGIAVADESGTVIVSSSPHHPLGQPLDPRLRQGGADLPATLAGQAGRPGAGIPVMADVARLDDVGWTVVAEVPADEALSGVARIRRVVLLLTALLVVVFGGAALRLRTVVRGYERSERITRDQARRIERMVAAAGDAFFSVDAHARVQEWNPRAEELFGWAADEVMGRSVIDVVVPPARRAAAGRLMQQFLASGQDAVTTSWSEVELQRCDGTLIPVEVTLWAVRDIGGWQISAFLRDLTARREAQRERERAAGRFRQLLHAIDDGVFGIDRDGLCTFVNPAAAHAFGYDGDELLGADHHELVHHHHADGRPYAREDCLAALTLQTGARGRRDDEVFWRRDGSSFPVEYSCAPVVEDGDVVGAVVTFTDITARKALERDLSEAHAQAMEASRLKTDFLATMSHEIRTPMNGVAGMAELLLHTDVSTEQLEYVETIRASCDALLRVIDDVLDFSKIEAGHIELEAIEFDVTSTVEDVARLVAPRAHAKEVELTVAVEPDVPRVVVGDPGRLRQVLLNLVGNAVKFTEDGEVAIEVRASEMSEDPHLVLFEVRDTGIGISPAQRARLFERFQQGSSETRRTFGGTGLGLAIARDLVELMGGTIDVRSEIGRGSTFTVALPFADAHISDVPARAGRALSLRGVRILVVDDNATNRTLLVRNLSLWGALPESVPDGHAAVDATRAAARRGEPFDVALVDHLMPGIGGLDVARILGEDDLTASVRVILLTSSARPGEGRQARAAGVYGYLTKPIVESALLDSLREVLDMPADQPPAHLVTRHSLRDRRGTTPIAPHLLLVEDNEVNRRVATRVLAKMGYRVDVAPTAGDALEAVTEHPYDAILMDCQLPDMDGYEAARLIRAAEGCHERIPIVAVTASATRAEQARCFAAGMDAFIAKPVRWHDLGATLERLLGVAEARTFSGAASAAATHDTTGAIDRVVLDDALGGIGRDAAADVIELFIETTERSLAELRHALTTGDSRRAAQLAHALRGSSGIFGARELMALFSRLEEQAPSASGSPAVDILTSIETAFDDVRRELASLPVAS